MHWPSKNDKRTSNDLHEMTYVNNFWDMSTSQGIAQIKYIWDLFSVYVFTMIVEMLQFLRILKP